MLSGSGKEALKKPGEYDFEAVKAYLEIGGDAGSGNCIAAYALRPGSVGRRSMYRRG